jgi:hypothetical protein
LTRVAPARAGVIVTIALALVVSASVPAFGGGLPPGGTFTDDNGNAHEGYVEAIAAAGVTSGCEEGLYCPADSVTRGQMASFLARALDLPASITDWFSDDDTSTHEANINRIADAGVTLGFSDGTFRPDDLVPRDQMASFLARAVDGLVVATQDYFDDDDGNTHEDNINIMAENAITLGCGDPGEYCPSELVRRDQMASFLGRALGLDPIQPPAPVETPNDVIQAVYAVPADLAPVSGRTAAIANEIAQVQSWFDSQTGGLHPVFVRDGAGVDVLTVNLTVTQADLQALSSPETPIVEQIHASAPETVGRNFAVVMEGNSGGAYCGRTGSIVFIPIANCGIEPFASAEWPYYGTYLMGHELTHLLGAVSFCAPNADGSGHVNDDNRDVLYSGPGGRDWDNLMLDVGNDDYYNHSNDGCPDIADSPLLGTG